ncbi:MAG: ADOP family duplicated permease [Gemmatimonadota bacterium]
MSPDAPPARAVALLERLIPGELREAVLGDLEEQFAQRLRTQSPASARRWFWREAVFASVALAFRGARRAVTSPGDSLMTSLLSDLRHAVRLLWNRPGFSVLAIATLAIGIGATTAIYSVIHPILLAPLPYPHPERIVTLWEGTDRATRDNLGYPTWNDIARGNHVFEATAVFKSWQATLSGRAEPERLAGQRVTHDYFKVLGVAPALGRDFTADDDVKHGPTVAILSNSLWRARFGGDPAIIGTTVHFNGFPYTIIGVMPAGFENLVDPTARLWAPMQYDLTLPWACRTCHHLRGIARLKSTATVSEAAAELNALSAAMVREHPTDYAKAGLLTIPLREDLTSGVRPLLLAIVAAVALVLLIACANVMNLLLAQGALRQGEFALRAALGAGRGRVIRQLLTESVTLAVAGGAAGILLAVGGVKALVLLSPPMLPRLSEVGVHGSTLLFALALTTLVGIGFGLVPAFHASRRDLNRGIRQGARRVGGRAHLVRSSLVIGEVALALTLLIGTGLLLQSVRKLLAVSPGFETAQLLTMQVQTSGVRYNADSATFDFFDRALRAARAVPGVESAALTSQLPLSDDFDKYGIHLEAHPRANPEEDPSSHRYAITPGYLATMKIPLLAGRDIDEHDGAAAPAVVLVNQSFAKRVWPTESPLGQRVRTGSATEGPWRTVVGVVGDVHQVNLSEAQPDALYLPEVQWDGADGALTLVVRSRSDPTLLASALRQAVWSVDKDQPIVRVATMAQLVESSAAERRFALVLFEAFGVVALVLAAAGVYGVLAGVVTERFREIGVRSALGATRANIIGMVMSQGLGLTAIGAVAGVVLALAGTRLIEGLLFGIGGSDAMTYVVVTFVLAAVAMLACLVPAWRAAGIDPAQTLRSE